MERKLDPQGKQKQRDSGIGNDGYEAMINEPGQEVSDNDAASDVTQDKWLLQAPGNGPTAERRGENKEKSSDE